MRHLRRPRSKHPGLHGERGARKVAAIALLFAGVTTACGPPAPAALAVDYDDGALLLVAGTFDRTCEEATSIIFECGRWELFVHLDAAAAAETTGPRPLVSPGIWAQSFTSDGRHDADECSLWGGTFEQGTVEITGSDGDRVAFSIDGTATGDFDADGSYDAVRCKDP